MITISIPAPRCQRCKQMARYFGGITDRRGFMKLPLRAYCVKHIFAKKGRVIFIDLTAGAWTKKGEPIEPPFKLTEEEIAK